MKAQFQGAGRKTLEGAVRHRQCACGIDVAIQILGVVARQCAVDIAIVASGLDATAVVRVGCVACQRTVQYCQRA